MRLRLREHFNIVVNGVVRDFGSKDQSKTQTETHSVKEPLYSVTLHGTVYYAELFTLRCKRELGQTPLGFIPIFPFPFLFPVPIPCSLNEPLIL